MKPCLMTLTAAIVFFVSCAPKSNDPERTRPYVERSKAYAMAAFTAMSGKLHHAISDSGLPYAMTFCSAQAYPTLDSLSRAHHVTLRRASVRTRNPADEATPDERKAIDAFQNNLSSNQPMEPIVSDVDVLPVHVYLPIQMSMPVCLSCHGVVGTDVTEEHHAIIKTLYPNDNATGHAMGELRGIWHIEFARALP